MKASTMFSRIKPFMTILPLMAKEGLMPFVNSRSGIFDGNGLVGGIEHAGAHEMVRIVTATMVPQRSSSPFLGDNDEATGME